MRRSAHTPRGWTTGTIASRLSSVFPGEWGSDPTPGKEVASVLRSTNLDDFGHVDLSTGADRHIPQIKLATKELRPGDILLEASGGGPGKPVGRVALFRGGTKRHICSNFFRTLRPNSQIHSGYLAWRLLHLYESPGIWNYQQQTTGLINLNLRDYLEQDLAWPPLVEQPHIAEVLDTLDEAIQRSEDRLQKLLSTREGLVVELLNQEDVKSQAERTLGEVCRSSGGSVQTGPFGSQLHAEDYKTEGTPIITVEHLGEGRIFHQNLPLVGEADRVRLQRYSLRTGDLVFSRVGAIDRCALVRDPENGWLFSGRLLRVRAASEDVNPAYLSLYLNAERARRWIRNHAVGSTMACLNTKILSGTPVLLPSRPVQDRIVAAVGALDDLLDRERLEVDKLRQAKSGMSVDLLTGRVRLTTGAPA